MDHLRAVELRHLRHFIAVAEQRHFGKAAERLFLSQPSLSHSIRQLETLLGVTLLDREDRRDVRVTPSGEALLAYAREFDAQLHAALRAVQAVESKHAQQIRIGYNDGEPLSQRPAALRSAMQAAGLPVAFRRLSWGEEALALRRGTVDVLLARLPIDLKGLRHEVILVEPRAVCLPAGHRLARRRVLRLADLRDVPIVVPVGGGQDWQHYWRGLPRPGDHLPLSGPEVHSPEETFDVVASGVAACFVPASMAPPGMVSPVRFVPVTDLEPSSLAVVWSGRPAAWLQALMSAATLLARGPGS